LVLKEEQKIIKSARLRRIGSLAFSIDTLIQFPQVCIGCGRKETTHSLLISTFAPPSKPPTQANAETNSLKALCTSSSLAIGGIAGAVGGLIGSGSLSENARYRKAKKINTYTLRLCQSCYKDSDPEISSAFNDASRNLFSEQGVRKGFLTMSIIGRCVLIKGLYDSFANSVCIENPGSVFLTADEWSLHLNILNKSSPKSK